MTQATEEAIRNYIVETFLFGQDDGFQMEDSLLERGIVDSTGVLELVTFLEEQFGVHAMDEELVPDNFDSIRRLAAFVQRKKTEA